MMFLPHAEERLTSLASNYLPPTTPGNALSKPKYPAISSSPKTERCVHPAVLSLDEGSLSHVPTEAQTGTEVT